MDTAQLITVLFIIGITCEAMTAALSAGRQRMDLFGVIALAALTGLGGGTIRDILLDDYPLTWVEEPMYLVIVVVAAITTVSLSFLMHYFRVLFLVLDSVGLAVFSVIGTQVALGLGHGYVIACVAAVVNGISGGVLRDLMSDRIPLVFSKEIYASISIFATSIYMTLLWVGLDENWTIVITLIAAFATRLIAIYFGMGLPVFDYRGKSQPVDPRLRLSYQLMRRGVRTARRRAGLDAARYALLNRRQGRSSRRGRRSEPKPPKDGPGDGGGKGEQKWPPGTDQPGES